MNNDWKDQGKKSTSLKCSSHTGGISNELGLNYLLFLRIGFATVALQANPQSPPPCATTIVREKRAQIKNPLKTFTLQILIKVSDHDTRLQKLLLVWRMKTVLIRINGKPQPVLSLGSGPHTQCPRFTEELGRLQYRRQQYVSGKIWISKILKAERG